MRHSLSLFVAAATCVGWCMAASSSTSSTGTGTTTATATATTTGLIIPVGSMVGTIVDDVEYFRGIPYAEAPTGTLRLRPPVRVSTFDDTIQATGVGPSCPQMTAIEVNDLVQQAFALPQVAAALAIASPAADGPAPSEDCLALSVTRPRGTAPDAGLPVLFWLHGGGFELGSANTYNGSVLVPRSVAQGQPMILVAANYRLGGFGFLPGAEALAGGAANLGLLDQRAALEWVADHIAALGGDPARVTIAGQSAGAFSVFDQMALYDGDNTYNGAPLFRAGVLSSGSILPAEPVDGPRAQAVFDAVVEAAGCAQGQAAAEEKLDCLRALDYETYLDATNVVPSPFSDSAPASSFVARPDGTILTDSPDALAAQGRFAKMPIIIGDQEDEGTFFGIVHTNLTTEAAVAAFLRDVLFQNATAAEVAGLLATYPDDDGSAGSPFGTGTSNEEYPEYKRLSALLGDTYVALLRRVFLSSSGVMPAWSYLATYDHDLPILGTFHNDDLARLFYGTDDVSVAMQSRYIAFVDALDPNAALAFAPEGFATSWPAWQEGQELLEFGANSTGIISDDFRNVSYEFIKDHIVDLRV